MMKRGDMMLGAEEVLSNGKQICCILAVVDVNDFVALCVDVEVRREALCIGCA